MLFTDKNKILNSSWIGKALNQNIDYFMYYTADNMSNENTSTASLHYIQWFHENKKLNLCEL